MARYKILIIIALIAVLGIAIFFAYTKLSLKINFNLSNPLSAQTYKPEDIVFVSESDLQFQAKVKSITGYDWAQFPKATDNEKASIAALLFLANEIESLDNDFAFVNRSVGLKKSELGKHRLNASDVSRENLIKLVGNMKAVENIFLSKGLKSAKIRANRLSIMENFFFRSCHSGDQAKPGTVWHLAKPETPESVFRRFWTRRVPDGNPSSQNDGKRGICVPEGKMDPNALALFAEKLGLTVSDYSKLVSLVIVNYNLFVR